LRKEIKSLQKEIAREEKLDVVEESEPVAE
jgi:hypothetical protein